MSRLSTIYRPGNVSTRRHLQLTQQDSFPLLDSKEITICLQSCDFISTEELVSKPTSQFIKSLFEQFLDTFMGLSTESIEKKVKSSKSGVENGHTPINGSENGLGIEESESDSDDITPTLSLIGLHRAAYKFFQGCGIYDLTLMDIVRPDPYRTRRLLSAVVNFARFREEHSAECEELVQESEISVEKIRKVQNDNNQLTQQLEELKLRIETDESNQKKATLKQVHSYNLKLEAELKKLKKSQEIVTLEHSQYKEEKSRLIEKLDDIQYLVFESTKELDRLKGHSQTDVAVLTKIIQDLKHQLAEVQSQYNKVEKRDSSVLITIDSIQLIENELKNLFRILEEITHDSLKEREAKSRLTDSQEYLEQLKLQNNDLSRQIQQIQRQLSNMQDKTNKLKVQADERISKSQQQLASYRNDYTKLVEERNQKEGEFNKKKELISEIESTMAKKKLDYSMEVRNTELKVTRLNAQIRLYLEEVGKKVL